LLSRAPGAKTPETCPWWVYFWADQWQKSRKSAPGGHFSGVRNEDLVGQADALRFFWIIAFFK